eukprot:scaffold11456_cov136-Isochrysis_galbana.AAC.1
MDFVHYFYFSPVDRVGGKQGCSTRGRVAGGWSTCTRHRDDRDRQIADCPRPARGSPSPLTPSIRIGVRLLARLLPTLWLFDFHHHFPRQDNRARLR